MYFVRISRIQSLQFIDFRNQHCRERLYKTMNEKEKQLNNYYLNIDLTASVVMIRVYYLYYYY